MARILTGIQSTGVPHLGNILGAILPALELSAQAKEASFFFIADLHSLTSIKEPERVRQNTNAVAAAWLACGLDANKDVFYRQSHVPEVCELAWYLNCFAPYPMLANAHSFKDKSDNLKDVNAGLFTYPVLMAADILLYDTDYVPVGKDQKQHLEITRDVAGAFNRAAGDVLRIPEVKIKESVMTVPGLDGRKMSKSYNNFIDLFQTDKKLRKNVMAIVTDSLPLEAPKDPETCNVVKLYETVASAEEVEEMKRLYRAGNFGYGNAKQMVYEKLLEQFAETREKYAAYLEDTEALEKELRNGEERARVVAREVITRVRAALAYI